MAEFKDARGKRWDIRINVSAVKRVRDLLGVELHRILDPAADVGQQLEDPETLVNTIYLLCSAQADEAGVSDEQFGRRLAGDAIAAATKALLAAIVEFASGPQRLVLLGSLKVAAGIDAHAAQQATSDEALAGVAVLLRKRTET
ncbi:MAG: hypothetical protein IT348_19430 [Candidatus Eisenbacteria bacterium]|nr:hypothetical protein [Candidatus Eisenbacteria bacterium]